jgi:hypothetical protein
MNEMTWWGLLLIGVAAVAGGRVAGEILWAITLALMETIVERFKK